MAVRRQDAVPGVRCRSARLGPIAEEHSFYLGGGTAVALHLGHRRSVAFDWFTGDRLADPVRWMMDWETIKHEIRSRVKALAG